MNRIEQVFGKCPVLLPVVHPIGWDAALDAIGNIHRAGAAGIFLIDQGMDEPEVLRLVMETRGRYPALWVGVNLLSRTPAEALEVALDACDDRIDGIWSDNAGIDEHGGPQPRAEAFVAAREARKWKGLYFGGVAFKYQRAVADTDLGRVATLAAPFMDVICTSGPGTGQAADVDKVRAMHGPIGDVAVALASGITAENIRSYMRYVQAFLVGTGVETEVGVIDEAKLVALLQAIWTQRARTEV